MFGAELQSGDLVAVSYAAATTASLATAVLAMLGLSFTSERWRIPLALSGVALVASAFAYYEASQTLLAAQKITAASRYVAWFTVQPMQVAATFFYARMVKPVPASVFWRAAAAAILMVLSRYMGQAGFFNATLGVLLSIAFWLYILGEMYFGAMSAAAHAGSKPVRLGYFWIRLIFTIGWAIYPVLYFIVIYTLADFVNLITTSMIVLAVAGQERY
jgi:sensory rhodopsin